MKSDGLVWGYLAGSFIGIIGVIRGVLTSNDFFVLTGIILFFGFMILSHMREIVIVQRRMYERQKKA